MGRGRGEVDDQLAEGIERFSLDDLSDISKARLATATPVIPLALADKLGAITRALQGTRSGAAKHEQEVRHLAALLRDCRRELLSEKGNPDVQKAVSEMSELLARSLLVSYGPTENDLSDDSLEAGLRVLSHRFEVGSGRTSQITPLIVRRFSEFADTVLHLRESEDDEVTICERQIKGRFGVLKSGWVDSSARGSFVAAQRYALPKYQICEMCASLAVPGTRAGVAMQEGDDYGGSFLFAGFEERVAKIFEQQIWDGAESNSHNGYALLLSSGVAAMASEELPRFRAHLFGESVPASSEIIKRLLEEPQTFYQTNAYVLDRLAKQVRKAGYKESTAIDQESTEKWLQEVANVALSTDIPKWPRTWGLLACKHLFPKALDRALNDEIRKEEGSLLRQLGIRFRRSTLK